MGYALVSYNSAVKLLYSGGTEYTHTRKTMDFSMLHRHLVFSFGYWYNRQYVLFKEKSERT